MTPKTFKGALYNNSVAYNCQSLAELGFVVVNMDGRAARYSQISAPQQ